jgi:hypothetical protein
MSVDMVEAPSQQLPGCAVVARLRGGTAAGTAAYMTSWLLVENPGPWPTDALQQVLDEAFTPDQRDHVDELQAQGMRMLLIRRPGRHKRSSRHERRVYFGGMGGPRGRWMESIRVNSLSELATLDLNAIASGDGGLGEPVDGPMFLICTHGAKDMCCALLGRPLAASLSGSYPDNVWEVSHLGGDRWAGNLLVVPHGFLHGQLDPTEAHGVARAAFEGEVEPEYLRGRTSAPTGWMQYAEIAVRKQTGLRGLDDVLAVSEEPVEIDLESNARRVRVRAGRQTLDVLISRWSSIRKGPSRCTVMVAPSGYITESITVVED